MVATDNDEGENAEITYSIYHVSNNGLQKFKIDPKTGIIETIGKLNAGEQYSITVQATDKGGKYSQTIVEVNVIPGPNTRSPVFQQPVYEVQVSEGASINSTVATITVSIVNNVRPDGDLLRTLTAPSGSARFIVFFYRFCHWSFYHVDITSTPHPRFQSSSLSRIAINFLNDEILSNCENSPVTTAR